MAKITKKAKYRDLFTENYQNCAKETEEWKPTVDKEIKRDNNKIRKFLDEVEFVDLNMQTAIRVSYDYGKSLDENLEEYKDQKRLQDESDQINFLR